jgi:hypothetical protein
VQHESHPLIGIEALEYHHRRESGILAGDHRVQRIIVVERRDDRLRQPFADVRFASVRRRTQPVQREPADHGCQPRPQIGDRIGSAGVPVPAQPGILYDVLRVGDGAGQPVGDSQQVRTQFLELVDPRTSGEPGHATSLEPARCVTDSVAMQLGNRRFPR